MSNILTVTLGLEKKNRPFQSGFQNPCKDKPTIKEVKGDSVIEKSYLNELGRLKGETM